MKSIKKMLSAMLALTVISTLISAPVKADAEEIVLGNSSFTWSHNDEQNNENAYDGTYSISTWNGAKRTANVTFNVEETGTYTFDVNATIDLSNHDWSTLKFGIDSGEDMTTLTTSNTTRTDLAEPWSNSLGWVRNYSYNYEFVLEEGSHTLYLEFPQRSIGDSVAPYAFDCATFRPTNNLLMVDGEENTTIGNSRFIWSHNDKQDNENAYDGTYSISTWNATKRTANITFYVEETGTYTFDVNATIDLSNHDWSTLKFGIDSGEDMTTFTTSNTTRTDLAEPWSNSLGWVKNYAYNGEFLLEEGLHTLYFEFPQRSIDSVAPYAFDCATIKPTNKPTNNPVTLYKNAATTIGNSSFTWSSNDKQNNENAYDGTYSTSDWGGVSRTASLTFYVEESGSYKFDVNGVTNMTLDGAAPMKFSIDDGAMITLSNSNAAVSNLASPWTSKNNWTVKNIAYNNDLLLEAGLHTLNIKIPTRKGNDTATGDDDRVIYVFDCAKFTSKNVVVNVSTSGTTTIGNSSFLWNHSSGNCTGANAADGTYTKFEGATDTITAVTTVYLENSGEFILEVYGASSITNINLSNLSFKIDDGSSTVLNSSSATVSDLANPCIASGTFITKDIRCNNRVMLGAGLHTITFTVPKESNGRTEAYFAFDCAKLIEYGIEPEIGIEAEISDSTLELGAVATVTVTDASGNTVDNATITSTDSDVIYVAPDKSLTAVGIGRTTIIVSVRNGEGEPEHVASLNACVGYNGIYIPSVEINAGTITAQVQLDGVSASGLDAIAGVYEYDTDGKLIGAYKAEFVNSTGSFNIRNESRKTVLYIWRNMAPLYKETIVQ